MRHRTKKKTEGNMAENKLHQGFSGMDSSASGRLGRLAKERGPVLGEETEDESVTTEAAEKAPESEVSKPGIEEELQDQKDKYLRLYAEFDNYKKRVARDREELIKYGNESLLYELLPVIDNLEMAMKHSSNDASAGLAQGVEITLKEFLRVIDKFGLLPIEASGKMFDPSLHHAMIQIERDDFDENIVVEELRKGYMLREKVLRPSLVSVSKKKAVNSDSAGKESPVQNPDTDIKINIIEEER